MTKPPTTDLQLGPLRGLLWTLCLTLFCLAGPLHGQSVRAFGNDPGDFAKDFSKHLTELVGKKEVEPILATFQAYFLDPIWEGDDAQREAFMRVAREMLRRRVVTTEPWL